LKDSGAVLIRELAALRRGRKTGLLEVRGGGVTTLLYVRSGSPVFAEQGTLADSLGRILRDEGMLTEPQFAAVVQRMTERLVDNELLRFGEAAIALGFVTPEQIAAALALQVRRRVVACIEQRESTRTFRESEEELEGITPFPCEVAPLALEAMRRCFDGARCDGVLAQLGEKKLKLREPAAAVGERLGIAPVEHRFLRTLETPRTAGQAVAGAPIDSLSAAQILTAAVLLGEIVPAEEARAPAPAAPAPAAPRPIAPEPVAVRPAPPASAEEAARDAFGRGLDHLNRGRFAQAAEQLGIAHAMKPGDPKLELHARWAEYRSLSEASERERAEPEIEKLAKRLLRADAADGFAHYVRGFIAFRRGEEEQARKSLAAAVKADPKNVDAVRHHRLLLARSGGSGKRQA
jgi:tetratricopeptide (TPR) repeat protein